jgi:hypothetical protein
MPKVMNVGKNPAYPAAVEALKADGVIPRRVRLRQSKGSDTPRARIAFASELRN